jgi:hypothetical protein
MIRRDYLLRMIEEFLQALARIKGLKQNESKQEAALVLDTEFQRLMGCGAAGVARLTETELQAALIEGAPTQIVREKTLILTALLKEAGDLAALQDKPEESQACYLKGLNLLLEVQSRGEVCELPEFVPRVELFREALGDGRLPLETEARLMQHFERIGEFGRAEDALFAMLAAEPGRQGLVEFGVTFYERLASQSDAALAAGNLPREELAAGLNELKLRRAARL